MMNVPPVLPPPLLIAQSPHADALIHLAEQLLDERLYPLFEPHQLQTSPYQLFSPLQERLFSMFGGQPAYNLRSPKPVQLTTDELELARRLHLVDTLAPPEREYDSALIFGGFFSSALAQRKLFGASSLASLSEVYILGSDRPLLPVELWQMKEHLGAPALEGRPGTEVDMLEVLWSSPNLASDTSTHFPAAMQPRVQIVRTPSRSTEPALPGTNETIVQLIEEHRSTLNVRLLAVSSQPYIRYQVMALVNTLLEHDIHPTLVHGCGPSAVENALTVAAYGNALAKLVFEERRLMKLLHPLIDSAQAR